MMILDEWNLEYSNWNLPTLLFMCSDDVWWWWFTFTVKDAFCVKDLQSRRGRVIFIGILRGKLLNGLEEVFLKPRLRTSGNFQKILRHILSK